MIKIGPPLILKSAECAASESVAPGRSENSEVIDCPSVNKTEYTRTRCPHAKIPIPLPPRRTPVHRRCETIVFVDLDSVRNSAHPPSLQRVTQHPRGHTAQMQPSCRLAE